MTDLTAPPTDRATCGWLPLPAGPPPSPPPDRITDRPAEPVPHTAGPTAPAPTTTAPTGPPLDDHAPDPAAVQAAIETLTRWLRCGGMLVCSSGDAAAGPGRTRPPDAVDPGPGPTPGQPGADPWPGPAPRQPGAPATTDRQAGTASAAVPDTSAPAPASAATAASCRHCRASDDPVAVRAWARERGFRVADRGRLPAAVVAAYVAAHPHP
jgi:hypothetical protein